MSFFFSSFSLITIFPALLVFPAADRYNYVPAAGLCFLYSFLVWRLYEVLSEKKPLSKYLFPKRALAIVVAAHCVVLGAASFKRTPVWKDPVSLFSDILLKYPREAVAYCGSTE